MGDLVDPKATGNKPDWNELYRPLNDLMRKREPVGKQALYEIADAERRGDFKHLKTSYEFHRVTDIWQWRRQLWAHCIPIFERPESKWPLYARTVAKVVALENPTQAGMTEEIPDAWRQDLLRIWTFKTTMLLIAGLIEGKFTVSPVAVLESIARFVDEQAPAHLKEALRSIVSDPRMVSLLPAIE
jgi:hypothetical protein